MATKKIMNTLERNITNWATLFVMILKFKCPFLYLNKYEWDRITCKLFPIDRPSIRACYYPGHNHGRLQCHNYKWPTRSQSPRTLPIHKVYMLSQHSFEENSCHRHVYRGCPFVVYIMQCAHWPFARNPPGRTRIYWATLSDWWQTPRALNSHACHVWVKLINRSIATCIQINTRIVSGAFHIFVPFSAQTLHSTLPLALPQHSAIKFPTYVNVSTIIDIASVTTTIIARWQN